MRNPDRFATGWHAPRRLLPALTLALVLMIGMSAQSLVVQAQGGGTQTGQRASVTYALEVDTGGLLLDRLCVGRSVSMPAAVRATAQVPGNPDAGRIAIHRVAIAATTDPTILSQPADTASTGSSVLDVPLQTVFIFRGESLGRTAIVFTAEVQSNEGTFRLRRRVPARVVPCEFRVDVGSVWSLTMHGAHVVMSANIRDARLSSSTGLRFEDSPGTRLNPLRWYTTVNRIRGCDIGHTENADELPPMHAEIIDDEIILTIDYRDLGLSEEYYRGTCPVSPSPDCREHRDGVCFVWPGTDRLTPQSLVNIIFPVTGGEQSVTHDLVYAEGAPFGGITITGGANIRLTPILPQSSQ